MFLNPLMLFGISAVSIPIIIHLLNRRKFQKVVWGAMRFLKVSIEKNQKRIQIEDLLLLLLRCILIALLALALARPILKAAADLWLPKATTTAVIVLDVSASMSQTDGVHSRLVYAKQAAADIVKTLPNGSSVAVILASDTAHPLIPEPSFDLTLVSSMTETAPLHDRSSNLRPGIDMAIQTLKGRSGPKEVYVITDGQSLAWQEMAKIHDLLEENKFDIKGHVIFVSRLEERNLGVSDLRADGGLAPMNQPVRMEVQVTNYSSTEATDVNVSIAVDEEPPMDQATIPLIPANESRSVSLFIKLATAGHHSVTAKITADHLPADDTRSIAMRAVKDVKVLMIDGEKSGRPQDHETYYLRNALRAVPRAARDEYHIKVIVREPTDLESIQFEEYDAVMAANVTDFDSGTVGRIVHYVRNGGSLFVFPGEKIHVAFYNDELYRRYQLLPAMLGPTRGDAVKMDKFFHLSNQAQEHPILAPWKDPASGTLASARFFKAHDLVIDDKLAPGPDSAPAGQARVILRFAEDNRPAMIERNWGQGRVILFASTADGAWNDLGARAGIFVPLMHRTMQYLMGRQDEHLNLQVGQKFTHISPIEMLNRVGMVAKARRSWSDGDAKLPEVEERRVFELVDNAAVLTFEGTHFAGPYQVHDAEGLKFAVQPDPAESSIDPLSDTQIDDLGKLAQVVRWDTTTGALSSVLETKRNGTELWLPLAMIVLALATMETLLAHWFSKSK